MRNILLFIFLMCISAGLSAQSLATPFNSDNGASGIFFNINALSEVTINDFETNIDGGGPYEFAIFYKAGSYVGSENTSGDWTSAGSASGITGAGVDNITPLPISINVTIPAGQTYGFYIIQIAPGDIGDVLNYTNGSGTGGTTVLAADANIEITEGTGSRRPAFSTPNFTPRNPNIVVNYNLAGTAPVPTLGEWGMILLVLLTLTGGVVMMRVRRSQLAMGNGQYSVGSVFSSMPFNSKSYGRILLAVFGLVAVGFAVAILTFGYTLTNADIPGILVCVPVLSYLVYLVKE